MSILFLKKIEKILKKLKLMINPQLNIRKVGDFIIIALRISVHLMTLEEVKGVK